MLRDSTLIACDRAGRNTQHWKGLFPFCRPVIIPEAKGVRVKAWRIILVVVLAVSSASFLWLKWKQDVPRRNSFKAIQAFAAALNSGNGDALHQSVVLPAALSGRTSAEQVEFLTKALRDEISAEGLAVLKRQGKFGPLQELFPQEAATWAAQAGVKAEDCVAFRMERDNIRAEVVLVREGEAYRVVRCNNVKQMAGNF